MFFGYGSAHVAHFCKSLCKNYLIIQTLITRTKSAVVLKRRQQHSSSQCVGSIGKRADGLLEKVSLQAAFEDVESLMLRL